MRVLIAVLFFIGCPADASLATDLASITQQRSAEDFARDWRAVSKIPAVAGAARPTAEQVSSNPRIRALAAEFVSAVERYRNEIITARSNNMPPRSCPPKNVNLTIDNMVADIENLPKGSRTQDLYLAISQILDEKFRCAPK